VCTGHTIIQSTQITGTARGLGVEGSVYRSYNPSVNTDHRHNDTVE